MIEWINNGGTVVIANYLHAWQVTKKTLDRFEKAGMTFFKIKNNELFVANGKKYVCIDGCAIKAYK
jgi:hypothetical protein